VLALVAALALGLAWQTRQQLRQLEAELVRRQADSHQQATEARLLARQAEQGAREAAAKLALLEARVAETALQRSQVEELMQGLARSRDENVLADVDTALRVALQQSAITGSAEPLVSALRQAEERLARFNQPRLERVRRAVAQDLERARAAGQTDFNGLATRIDEVIRRVDELPLLATSHAARTPRAPRDAALSSADAAASAGGQGGGFGPWLGRWLGEGAAERWRAWQQGFWEATRDLVRVSRIDNPQGVLVSPQQALFLRENLKLRLLNARLALLSRQFDVAQADLREAASVLDTWFDRDAARVAQAAQALNQVAQQARLVVVPRPDATLAAIATLNSLAAGR